MSKTRYTDKDGFPISIGDILKYDEGVGYAKSIDEVILKDGVVQTMTLFNNRLGYEPDVFDEAGEKDEPIELKWGTYGGKNNSCYDHKIIKIAKEDLTLQKVSEIFK